MIYLLHSDTPIGGVGSKSASHYLGYCNEGNLWTRMKLHATDTSRVAIISAFHKMGATLYLVRVWPDGGRALERKLKTMNHYKLRCPVCSGFLPLAGAVPISVASQLKLTFDALPSQRPTRTALIEGLNGTAEYKGGLLTQLVIQAPGMWSGSLAGVTPAIPGGPGSHVVVLTSGLVARSVGTKLQWSDYGRKRGFGSTQVSPAKHPTVEAGPTPHDMQLELGIADEEGYQV